MCLCCEYKNYIKSTYLVFITPFSTGHLLIFGWENRAIFGWFGGNSGYKVFGSNTCSVSPFLFFVITSLYLQENFSEIDTEFVVFRKYIAYNKIFVILKKKSV